MTILKLNCLQYHKSLSSKKKKKKICKQESVCLPANLYVNFSVGVSDLYVYLLHSGLLPLSGSTTKFDEIILRELKLTENETPNINKHVNKLVTRLHCFNKPYNVTYHAHHSNCKTLDPSKVHSTKSTPNPTHSAWSKCT